MKLFRTIRWGAIEEDTSLLSASGLHARACTHLEEEESLRVCVCGVCVKLEHCPPKPRIKSAFLTHLYT